MSDRMRVNKGDLAALSFRARDTLRHAVDRLEDRVLEEGTRVTITLESTVQRTPAGHLIFGDVTGYAHDL